MELIEMALPSRTDVEHQYNRLAQLPRTVDDQKVLTVREARRLTGQLLAALEQVRYAELEKRGVQPPVARHRWRPDDKWLGLAAMREAGMDPRYR